MCASTHQRIIQEMSSILRAVAFGLSKWKFAYGNHNNCCHNTCYDVDDRPTATTTKFLVSLALGRLILFWVFCVFSYWPLYNFQCTFLRLGHQLVFGVATRREEAAPKKQRNAKVSENRNLCICAVAHIFAGFNWIPTKHNFTPSSSWSCHKKLREKAARIR